MLLKIVCGLWIIIVSLESEVRLRMNPWRVLRNIFHINHPLINLESFFLNNRVVESISLDLRKPPSTRPVLFVPA